MRNEGGVGLISFYEVEIWAVFVLCMTITKWCARIASKTAHSDLKWHTILRQSVQYARPDCV
jgi:hypothetical protein